MHLKSINVYSDYLGNPKITKEITKKLREETEFLDYEYATQIKYCDNKIMKQLNISCSERIQEMYLDETALSLGYPVVMMPFDYKKYDTLSMEKKLEFWTLKLIEIFEFLYPTMQYDRKKIDTYIECLKAKYIVE